MSRRKKHEYSDLLKYMGLLQGGSSLSSIHQEYGINKEQLHVLWKKYERFGSKGLHKKNNIKADFALKKRIMLDIEENHITLHAAALKYGASYTSIYVWHQQYRKGGLAALKSTKRRGRPPIMGRSKKDKKPLTELELLRKEVQELKTENALLKKVRALVEDRNARLREIGHGPSKN